MKFLVTLAALAAVASAIRITEPKENAKLDFSGTNTIKWEFVESDPAEFEIQLIDSSTSPETAIPLVEKVKRDAGEYKFENFVAPPGTKYRVKFFAVDKKNTGQLAESQSFAVTKSGVKPTSAAPAPSTAPTGDNAGAGGSTSTSKAGAMATAVGLAAPAAALLAFLA